MTTTSKSKRQIGIEHGFRSGLEDQVSAELTAAGVEHLYEPFAIPYTKPAKVHKYTPDHVILHNGIVIETKGRFVTADRQKHLLIQQQHPHLDIRFLFSNPNTRISKQSKTTYAMWCTKHGFLYAKAHVPQEWLDEAPEEARMAALDAFLKATTT
jgi:hypothetical protein